MRKLTRTKIEALCWAAFHRGRPPRTTKATWAHLLFEQLVYERRGPDTVDGRPGTVYYDIASRGELVLEAFDLGSKVTAQDLGYTLHNLPLEKA